MLLLFSKEILIQIEYIKLNMKIPEHLPFKYLSGSFLVNHIIEKFSFEFRVSLFKIMADDGRARKFKVYTGFQAVKVGAIFFHRNT